MSEYELIHELCESRLFRSKASIDKYSANEANNLFYSILLATIALALNPKTNKWASKYASQAGAFGNFDYFRPSGNDLYVLTHVAQHVNHSIAPAVANNLLRIYRGIGKGDVDSNFTEQTLLRLERSLAIKNAKLRSARRVLMHWGSASEAEQSLTVANIRRLVMLQAKLAEVLPYLAVALKGEAGHYGKMTPGKAALAIAGAGLAGLAIGLQYDPNKRWSIFKNSAVFDGSNILTEDRPTQLFHIVQNLNHHPDIERVVSVNYIADGISAFVRDTFGNAYELEIRPAPFAKGHQEKRGVTESDENGWEWRCMNVVLEHGRVDAPTVGNDAAKIARSSKQAAATFNAANKGNGGVDDNAHDVQDHLSGVRGRYGVELVDDFKDVLELPNSENETDEAMSMFSKDNRK